MVESLVVGDEVGQVDGLAGGGDGTSGCGGIESHCTRETVLAVLVCVHHPAKGTHSWSECVGERRERERESDARRSCSHLSLRQPASGADQQGFKSRENKRSATMFSRYDSRVLPESVIAC